MIEINANNIPLITDSINPSVLITELQNDRQYTVTLVTHLKSGLSMTETIRVTPSEFAIAGITPEQIIEMEPEDIAYGIGVAISSLSTAAIHALNSLQLGALTVQQIQVMDTTDIIALSISAIPGLTSTQISEMTTAQFNALPTADLAALSSTALRGLTTEQAAALTSGQISAFSSLSFDAINTAGLSALTYDAVRGITAEQVDTLSTEDMIALGMDISNFRTASIASLDSIQLSALTSDQISVLNTLDVSALDSAAIPGLTTYQVSLLTSAQIAAMSTASFDALSTDDLIALTSDAIAGIRSDQVDTLSTDDIAALGVDIANMGTAAMASLDSIQLHALLTEQIAAFDASDIAALSSSAIPGLTSDQIAAMSTGAFNALTLDDLDMLSSDAVNGIRADQVDTLSSADILALGVDIANLGTAAMASLDSTQLNVLTTAQFAEFDAIDIAALSSDAIVGLTSAQIAVMSTGAFDALTIADLGALTSDAILGIRSDQVDTLNTSEIVALGIDIANMNTSAMASLDSTQLNALTTAQFAAFDASDIAALTYTAISGLTSAQIAAMSTSSFNALTLDDLAALTSDAVVGIRADQVDTLSTADIVALGTDIANMGTAAIASLDSIQVDALTTAQFAALNSTDIASLTSTAVVGIRSDQVDTLTTDEIVALGVNIANLNSAAMASLDSVQIAALQTSQVFAFGTEDYVALGITGISSSVMLSLIKSVVSVKTSDDINSKIELQALSDAGTYIMALAALNSLTTLSSQLSTLATLKAKLILLGVTGVNDQNIKAIWVAIRDSNNTGADVDTLAKLQTIINNANDSSIITPSVTARTYTENATALLINDDLTLSDADSTSLTGATIEISSGFTVGDVLAFTAENGITGSFNSTTHVLTLTGTATINQYQTALRSVTYFSSSDNPTATSASRTFSWQVNDGTVAGVNNLSDIATSTISITAVNDAPTLDTALVNQTAAYGTTFTYTFSSSSFSDLDNATLSYTATLADNSALPSWLTFTESTHTFSGTPNSSTDLSIKVTASDGSLTAVGTFGIAIPPVITGIVISGSTGIQNNYLNVGDVVTASATFNEAVTVTGSPRLALNIGGTTVQSSYSSGSGTSIITFNYTILTGQTDSDGISIDANSVTLNSGTIKDSNGNAAVLTSLEVTSNSSYKVDTTSPSTPGSISNYKDDIGSITSTTSSASATDDTLPGINIGTGLTDTPQLYIWGVSTESTYDSVAGTLTPTTALASGSYDLSYTLTDAAGNESLPSPVISISIDITPPTTPSAPSSYDDNTGSITNTASTAAGTDDNTPGIYIGTGITDTPNLYANDVYIPATYSSGKLTPSSAMANATYAFKYTLTDAVGNESAKSPAINIVINNIPPATPSSFTSYKDNVGTIQSNTSVAVATDDKTPGINIGTGLTDTPKLYIDAVLTESTYDSGSGTLTPSSDLSDGTYAFTYTLSNNVGAESSPSPSLSITVNATAPATPSAPASYVDNFGSSTSTSSTAATTDDKTPGINIGTSLGGTPKLYVNGSYMAEATYDSGTGVITPNSEMANDTYTFAYSIVNSVGNESSVSPPITIIVFNDAPATPTSAPAYYIDNSGNQTTAVTTTDTQPSIFVGTGLTNNPNLYVNGTLVNSTYNSTNGTLTPAMPQADGLNAFTYTLTSAGGNQSGQSPAINITISTGAVSLSAYTSIRFGVTWGGAVDLDTIAAAYNSSGVCTAMWTVIHPSTITGLTYGGDIQSGGTEEYYVLQLPQLADTVVVGVYEYSVDSFNVVTGLTTRIVNEATGTNISTFNPGTVSKPAGSTPNTTLVIGVFSKINNAWFFRPYQTLLNSHSGRFAIVEGDTLASIGL